MFRLFQSLFSSGQARRQSARSTKRKCYLSLETLEDRCVPSTNALFVTSPLDNGAAGTLRYEVAHSFPGATIDIEGQTVAGKYGAMNIALTQGELLLTQNNVTINNYWGSTISGDHLSRVFEVANGAQVTLNNLKITGGMANGSGGGTTGLGGGILNDKGATVTLNSCTLSGNTAQSCGGGIYNQGGLGSTVRGTVIIDNSTLTQNAAGAGGALYNGGSLVIAGTTLSHNSASGGGGAICNLNGSTVTITSCILSNNSALDGGAIFLSGGTVTVIGDSFLSNTATPSNGRGGFGGAIYSSSPDTLNVAASTFSGNSPSSIYGPYFNDGGNIGL